MSEMIEMVAKAIAVRRGYGPDVNGEDTDDWRMFVEDARAAIEAMREPTEAMFGAAQTAIDPFSSASDADQYWQAMIDAALKG